MDGIQNMSTPIHQTDPFTSTLHPDVDYMLGTYMVIIALISVSLNSLVLITITFRKTPMSALDVYIWNLALCDLCHGLLAHPLVATSSFLHRWPLGDTACHAYSAIVFFLGTSNISLITAICLTRYMKICRKHLGDRITRRVTSVSLVPIYSNGIIWSVSPLLGWGSYAPEPFGLSCSLDWLTLPWSYTVFIFTFCYCFPLLCMVWCYGRLVISVRKATAHIRLVENTMDTYITKVCKICFCLVCTGCLNVIAYFQMTSGMCLCFIMAWTPYSVVSFFYLCHASHRVPKFMVIAAPFFAKSSTCYNPIIYFLTVKRFRKDISTVFSQCFGNSDLKHSSVFAQSLTFKTFHKTESSKCNSHGHKSILPMQKVIELDSLPQECSGEDKAERNTVCMRNNNDGMDTSPQKL